MKQNKKIPSNGYLVVASRTKSFYLSALNLIESIKDYHPEAHCTLVVDEHLSDERIHTTPDHYIFTETPDDYRGKLWGMWKTPYQKTMYLDADMECQHEDIATCFDALGDHDMMFTALDEQRDDAFKSRHFPAGSYDYNGGVCLYNSSNPDVLSFMERWWKLYTMQFRDEWWPTDPETGKWDLVNYGDREWMKYWDQFTLWYLLNKESKWSGISVGIFEDDIRWNHYTNFHSYQIRSKGPIVLMHQSAALNKDNPSVYGTGL